MWHEELHERVQFLTSTFQNNFNWKLLSDFFFLSSHEIRFWFNAIMVLHQIVFDEYNTHWIIINISVKWQWNHLYGYTVYCFYFSFFILKIIERKNPYKNCQNWKLWKNVEDWNVLVEISSIMSNEMDSFTRTYGTWHKFNFSFVDCVECNCKYIVQCTDNCTM